MQLKYKIEGLEDTLVRPLVTNIIEDLLEVLQLNPNTPIRTEELKSNSTWNIGDKSDLPIDGNKRFYFNVEYEDKSMNDITPLTTLNNNNRPIIYDRDENFYIKPVTMTHKLSIKISVKDRDGQDAANIVKMFDYLKGLGRDKFVHQLDTDYTIPNFLLYLANDIYNLKSSYIKPVINNFKEYLEKITNKNSYIAERVSDNAPLNLVAQMSQLDIVGLFTENITEVEKEKDEQYSQVNWTYEVYYSKPIFLDVMYPIMVCNNFLTEEFIDVKTYDYEEVLAYYKKILREQNYYFSKKKYVLDDIPIPVNDLGYLTIPSVDTYKLDISSVNVVPFLRVLISITEDDKRSLFNLEELQEIKLDEAVINYMRVNHAQLTNRRKSLFYITIYENNKRLPDDTIQIDENLNVYSTLDLDITKTYRVFVNAIVDIETLDIATREDIMKYRHLLESIIVLMHPVESAGIDFNSIDFKKLKYIALKKPREGYKYYRNQVRIHPGLVNYEE